MSIALVFTVGNIPKPPEKLFLINKKPSLIYIREGVIREFLLLLWNHFIINGDPPPSPFYEVPIYFFPSIFLAKKRDDFEGCLKGVDGCFKGVWRVLQGVWSVFEGCLPERLTAFFQLFLPLP